MRSFSQLDKWFFVVDIVLKIKYYIVGGVGNARFRWVLYTEMCYMIDSKKLYIYFLGGEKF